MLKIVAVDLSIRSIKKRKKSESKKKKGGFDFGFVPLSAFVHRSIGQVRYADSLM